MHYSQKCEARKGVTPFFTQGQFRGRREAQELIVLSTFAEDQVHFLTQATKKCPQVQLEGTQHPFLDSVGTHNHMCIKKLPCRQIFFGPPTCKKRLRNVLIIEARP